MQTYYFPQWILFFFIYSFVGWIWECCYVSVKERRLVNRGFMHGPFLPLYGSGAVAVLGCTIAVRDDAVLVRRDPNARLTRTNVKTLPYPGFPTDMQPQIATVLCLAEGTSVLTEGVWDNRYRYVDEFRRMGAQIQVDGKIAVIEGVDKLTGARIQACDLRAGAAMVIAGLAAQGTTEIGCIHHIERGYEDIVRKLSGVGADIRVVVTPDEDKQSQVG